MDLTYSKEYGVYRAEVRAFLEAEWPPKGEAAKLPGQKKLRQFLVKAIGKGYLYRHVPKRYGGAEQPEDALQATIIREEFTRAKAPSGVIGLQGLLVPTLIEHGTDWQKEKFIEASILGDIIWCQGFSEPGAGSDLASVRTRGERVGDEWVINGQKVWTTQAHLADYIFALVRTEPEASKHQGISYLIIDMKQPGIEVRPLRQMSGEANFNEVFFTDAKTPADWIVGERGQGWQVKSATLKQERTGNAGAPSVVLFKRLLKLAGEVNRNGQPALKDPEVRQWLSALEGAAYGHLYSGHRMFTKQAKGEDAGLFPLMNKLFSTEVFGMEVARIARELIGDDGLQLPPPRGVDWPPHGDRKLGLERWLSTIFLTHSNLIAGGASNIQRNVIAERGFGLPRES